MWSKTLPIIMRTYLWNWIRLARNVWTIATFSGWIFSVHVFLFFLSLSLRFSFNFVFMCQIDSVVSLEIYLGCQQLIYVFWNYFAVFLGSASFSWNFILFFMIGWIFSQLIIQNGIKLYIQDSPCCHKYSYHFNALILFAFQLWKHFYCSSF